MPDPVPDPVPAPLPAPARVLVIDIGKTNAKAAVVEAGSFAEVDVLTMPNEVRPGPPYPHYDVDGLWRFILDAARRLNARHPVGAVAVTTHGAAAALVDAAGGLALPVLDYEHDGPEETAAAYDTLRPGFAATGSPRLRLGLNLGPQLFWQFHRFPEQAATTAAILPYPQYWAFRLCGVRATEATSLGTHTDLWEPQARRFSALVTGQGWQRLMPPLRRAADVLGPVTAEVAAATGLDPATPVLCGIHDSNASLLPHLVTRKPPFSVVSTGTWVVSMAIGGRAVALDPARDTLINVNALGDPVPSGRFMGGREWARAMQGHAADATPADAAAVLKRGVMLLPALEPGSGPFQGRPHAWTVPEAELTDGERAVAVSWYLALMTAVCLRMIGAEGPACVEGPFANNRHYVEMLAAVLPGGVIAVTGASTGTSTGAALLALPPPSAPPGGETPLSDPRPALVAYAAHWNALAAGPQPTSGHR